MTERNIQTFFDGHQWIISRRQKSDVASNVRLMNIPKGIIEKYKGTTRNEFIFPVPTNNTCNNHIKKLVENAEIITEQKVAVNDSYRNKQDKRIEQTAFFNCSYWISSKVANFLVKGTLMELTGRVSLRAWLGTDGEPKAGLNFHISQIKLHGGGRKTKNVQPTARVEQDAENDLPF